jgi:hypothetical protein
MLPGVPHVAMQDVTRESYHDYQKMTKGWKLCVKRKDGTTLWERLTDLKESYPIKVAEFAISCNIHDKATFAWWYILAKCTQIISAVNRHYRKVRRSVPPGNMRSPLSSYA